jgi:hypothetical protein
MIHLMLALVGVACSSMNTHPLDPGAIQDTTHYVCWVAPSPTSTKVLIFSRPWGDHRCCDEHRADRARRSFTGL